VVNAAVEFDDVNLRPTYRLMVGVPGGSSGISIAQRLGITSDVIERARLLLTPESREAADLIAYLHRSRDELDRLQHQMAAERYALEEERAKLRTEWVGRQQKRIVELEAQFAEMQKRFDENVARVIEAVKDRELRAQLEKTTRRKVQEVRGEGRDEFNAALLQTISESQADLGLSSAKSGAISAGQLQPGTRIRVHGFSKPVVLRRIEGSSAEIEAGPLRMKIAVDEITGVEKTSAANVPLQSSTPGRNVTVSSQSSGAPADGEINVIGMRVEEATELVDKYLDKAALDNRTRVRIIHGHGTGALRKGLGEFLKGHPLVAKSSFESEEQGGKAITVVELRS
jgi:DNA mismatch repair protein MutS2